MEEVKDILPLRQQLQQQLQQAQQRRGEVEVPEWLAAQRAEGAREAMFRRVPKRFHASRFDTYVPKNESQVAALEATQQWVRDVLRGDYAMLALLGDTGTGKSHLLWSAAWALYEATGKLPYTIRWATTFADELRWGRSHNQPGAEVRRDWYAQPYSLIDEMRPTSGTDNDASELARYAMHCYEEMIPCLGTTNMGDLSLIMGIPAADRFSIVYVRGESQRGAS